MPGWRSFPIPVTTALMVVLVPGLGLAHGVHPHVESTTALTVTFSFENHIPMGGERFEIQAPESETIFQAGQTDPLGRVVFRPDREGVWVIRVFSEDGHGTTARIPVGNDLLTSEVEAPGPGQASKIIMGVSILFGLFGVLALVSRRKRV